MTYTVSEVVQAGWTPVTPPSVSVTVGPGQTVNVEFRNQKMITAPGPGPGQPIVPTPPPGEPPGGPDRDGGRPDTPRR